MEASDNIYEAFPVGGAAGGAGGSPHRPDGGRNAQTIKVSGIYAIIL